MIMLNNYRNSELLVNRIKTEGNDKLLHVNRADGKRVNGWVKVSESVAITDASGNAMNWYNMKDGVYYTIRIEEHSGRARVTLLEEMRLCV